MAEDRTIGAAISAYRASCGIPPDGGAGARWVTVRALGLPITFPNFAARRAILFLHDVHHLLSGYTTTWRGEAEIGAFELRTGCGRFWAAWMFNSGGFLFGLAIAPRAMFRAFVRAGTCTNFYGTAEATVAERPVASARRELGLDQPPRRGTWRDVAAFTVWALGVVGFWVAAPLAILARLFGFA
ncbi:MAG: hypothetical protein JNK15_21705 [Planctomycetes bacterium]|nr:hypothetical protein [Planctomycetota bacterium]